MTTINDQYVLELLEEAMKLLKESKNQMALFRYQQYCDLRRRYEQLQALNEPLRKNLMEMVYLKEEI